MAEIDWEESRRLPGDGYTPPETFQNVSSNLLDELEDSVLTTAAVLLELVANRPYPPGFELRTKAAVLAGLHELLRDAAAGCHPVVEVDSLDNTSFDDLLAGL